MDSSSQFVLLRSFCFFFSKKNLQCFTFLTIQHFPGSGSSCCQLQSSHWWYIRERKSIRNEAQVSPMYHPNMCIIYLVCMITSIERKSHCFPILCQLCPFKEQKTSLSVEFAQAGKSPVYCSCFFPFTFAPLVAILQYPWSSWNASGPAKPGVSRAERGCLDVTTSRSLQRWVNIGKNDDPNKHGTWRNWRLVAWIFWKKTACWWILLYWLVVSTHLKNISQNGHLPQIGMKIKNIWKHHPVSF